MEKQGGKNYIRGYIPHIQPIHDISYPSEFSFPVVFHKPSFVQGLMSPTVHFYDRFTGKILGTYGDDKNMTGSVTTLDCDVTITGEKNKVELIKHVLNSLSSIKTNLEKEGKIFSGSGMLITFGDGDNRKLILGKNKNGKLEDFGGFMFSLLVLNNVPLQANAIKETFEESKCLFNIQGAYEKKIDSFVDVSNDVDGTYYRSHVINLNGCNLDNVVSQFEKNKLVIQKAVLKDFTDVSFHEMTELVIIPVKNIDKSILSDRLNKIINNLSDKIKGSLTQFTCNIGEISKPNVTTIFAM
jgi:hypothetical protein